MSADNPDASGWMATSGRRLEHSAESNAPGRLRQAFGAPTDFCLVVARRAKTGGRVPPRTASRLWPWVLAAFALQAAAWTTWFIVASKHRVQDVPLAVRP
jgi:hypothetical protein